MTLPRIGITCEFEVRNGRAVYRLSADYVRAVVRAGGFPVLLANAPSRKEASLALDGVDGAIFSGGDDYDPRRYGERRHSRARLVPPEKEASDLRLIEAALDRDLPILGICGGCQLLNIALGGSLIQDIPSQVLAPLPHRHDPGRSRVFHPVTVTKETLLHRVLRRARLQVNSSHHQTIKGIGRGLRASARAPDGLIEAVESPARRFALGVQWHPERLSPHSPQGGRLFDALVKASARRRDTS